MKTNVDFAKMIDKGIELNSLAVKKRFSDKTMEEIEWEQNRRKKQQFSKMVTMRYYQFGTLLGALFFYLFVYTKYL